MYFKMPIRAKEVYNEGEEDEVEYRQVTLSDQDVVVERINISGLKRTKKDFVVDDVKPVMKAKTFIQAYREALKCKNLLMQKGIFSHVDVILDTTQHYENHKENGIQVVFNCVEKRRITGEIKTELSNQDDPKWVLKVLSPNVAGRGETISLAMSRKLDSSSGSMHIPTDFTLNFLKPLKNSSTARLSILNEKYDQPWNSSVLTNRGLEVEYKLPMFTNMHSFGWKGYWRELSALNRNASFAIRQNLGHSLKSALTHSILIDKTNGSIFPEYGHRIKLTEELAGLGGDSRFLKENLELSFYKNISKVTLSANVNAGFVYNFDKDNDIHLSDRFYMGGPLSLRGFEINSAGCKSGQDFTGGNLSWVVGLHAYTPLPFYWKRFGSGSWLDNFRMHAFLNAGNLLPEVVRSRVQAGKLIRNIRASYGLGLAYNFMGLARIEINYCLPIKAQKGDKFSDGFQFGIGLSFM